MGWINGSTLFLKLIRNNTENYKEKFNKGKGTISASSHDRLTLTELALPPETTRKLDKIYGTKNVCRHWTGGNSEQTRQFLEAPSRPELMEGRLSRTWQFL